MRICFVTPEYVTEESFCGGLANYLGRITEALVGQGHEVHVLCKSYDKGTLDYKGVTVHRVIPVWDPKMRVDNVDRLVPRKYYNNYQDIKAAYCLWSKWKKLRQEFDFDVVQVANPTACGLFFRREKKVPVITRLSSYRPVWDTMAGIVENAGVRLRWKIEKLAIKGTKYHYAPSEYVGKLIQKNYGIPVDVVESPFFNEETQADEGKYKEFIHDDEYFLFFGRLTQMKGVHVIAESLPMVFANNSKLKCVVIGPDAPAPNGDGMKAYLEKCAGDYARDRLIQIGSLRHDQLYPFIQNAKFIVLPSLADNLPNTCLESMGMGKVVLATTGSCFEQLIDDGKSGFLVPSEDADALADKIVELGSMSKEELSSVSIGAKERIEQLHPDHAIPRLESYYRTILEKHCK